MDSSRARTDQPPTASYQLPSPHNHKLTSESEGEKQNGENEDEKGTEQTWRRRGEKKQETNVTLFEEERIFSLLLVFIIL